MSTDKAANKKNEKAATIWVTGRIQSTQQVGTDKENYSIIEIVTNTRPLTLKP